MMDFHELYQTYAPDVYRFAYWLAANPEDAEDITSETFIQAWVNASKIRTETLKGYLFTIARNIHLGNLRKNKRFSQLEDNLPDPGPQPDQVVETQDDLARARKILSAVPEIDRSAFVLRIQHELPYAEIARVLQISISATRVKVYRVRLKMAAIRPNKEII